MLRHFDDFIKKLEKRLNEPLPGREAQVKMAPKPVDERRFDEASKNSSQAGGVMVLLYPHHGDVYLPLMKRPKYDGAHSGQISFPGGKYEEKDGDLTITALRETEEEIGVRSEQIQLIGSLTELFIIASNFNVFPSVGFLTERPRFIPDPVEVDEVLEVSLWHLRDIKQRRVKEMTFGPVTIQSPYFDVAGNVVWGATAMMLSELLQIIEEIG